MRRALLSLGLPPLVLGVVACASSVPPEPTPPTPTVSTDAAPSAMPQSADRLGAGEVSSGSDVATCPDGTELVDGHCMPPPGIPPLAAMPIGPAPAPSTKARGPFPQSNHPAMTKPQLAQGKAPASFRVRFETTAGDFTVQCRRDWAPHGADRFYSLVAIRYFDDVSFFRAVKGFVVQFGLHGDPAVNQAWKDENIDPDRVRESNLAGTLTFAQAGRPAAPSMTADSRSTQLFVNLGDNQRLDSMGFAPICRVTTGLDAVKRIHTGYGEKAGRDQTAITKKGNAYLRQTYPDLDYIETARIVR